jgi:hypothetical protein
MPRENQRTLLYAEYLAEDLLLDLPHRQFVFTIPKILRPFFKADKRLFGAVSRLIFTLLSDFFSLAAGRPLLGACVVSYQSFGEFARLHAHTGTSSSWKEDLPGTTALCICRLERIRACLKSGKRQFRRYSYEIS